MQPSALNDETFPDLLLNSLPLAITCWTRDLTPIFASKAYLNFFNVKNMDEYKQKYLHFNPQMQPDGQSSVELGFKYINEAFEKGSSSFLWAHINEQGDTYFVNYTLTRIPCKDDYIVASQLHELQNTYTNLHEEKERIQAVFDATPLSITFWSKKLQVIDCNQAALTLYKFASKQEYKAQAMSIYPPYQPNGKSSIEHAKNILSITFEQGYYRTEWEFQTFDGEKIPAEVTLTRVKYDDDYVVVEYTKDLREIRAREAEAKEAEERAKVMLDTFPMGANFWNKDSKLIDCNMEAVKLHGFTHKQEYIENFHTINPELQPDGSVSQHKIAQILEKVFDCGFHRTEWLCIHPQSNEPLPVELTLVRIFHNNEPAVICYVRDLREFKAMLNEISNVEKDLRLARDTAEKSAKAKSEFLANMSHEIRTPMNGILGLLHILSQTNLQTLQEEYVNKCLYSANNLLRIINDILDISKIEAGKLELEYTPFCVSELCEDVKSLYDTRFADKELFLDITEKHDINTKLIGDPLRLKQVLFNLVSNALKFTEQGGVSISITSRAKDNNTMHCTFAVKDTGIGLSQKQATRLFAPFSQADSSVTRKYGGTGLGLAISKSIVEMFEGRMWVESEKGKGSTFFFDGIFTIATEKALANIQSTLHETTTSYNIPADYIAKGHILLVEDNEINQLIAEELLKAAGYTLDIAENGEQSLQMLDKQIYDLVLMDIQMPIMDGLTAAKNIRKMEKFAKLPIIAMSAHAMAGDKEISLAHGMNDHITKPIAPEILYYTLYHWLSLTPK